MSEMPHVEPNRFIRALSEALAAEPLAEKRLVAPSLRVGYQWLDTVTRRGGAVLNTRVSTLRSMAMDLATPEIASFGKTLLGGIRKELIVADLFGSLRGGRPGYLAGLDPSPGLVAALVRAIDDLRLAGLKAERLDPDSFEVADKGEELRWLLKAYEAVLDREQLIDFSDVFRLALKRVTGLSGPPPEALVLMPSDMEDRLHGLERALWKALPRRSRHLVDTDRPDDDRGEGDTDAGLLCHIAAPADAPTPKNDGTAGIVRAVGEVNEVREVFRRCIEGGIPFDDVEIIHTDSSTFVPLIYEVSARVSAGSLPEIPVTFAEGIPLSYTGPGRALVAWTSWVREGFSQEVLVRAVQEGLFELDLPEEVEPDFVGASEVLRRVPIGFGAEDYLGQLDREILRLEALARVRGDRWGSPHFRRGGLSPKALEKLRTLRALVAALIPDEAAREGQTEALTRHVLAILTSNVRSPSRLDGYARRRLIDSVAALAAEPDDELDVWAWLADLTRTTHVKAQGPRPGRIHVSPLRRGGHSGRGHTFVVGLDDTRFPGTGMQDPLLLDGERVRISGALRTARDRLAEKVEDLERLFCRLRGEVVLSFTGRSLVDDRQLFAGPAVLAVYRILSGEREGDHEGLLDWLPPPVSFAPSSAEHAVDTTEWWLARACGDDEILDPRLSLEESFTHLVQGRVATEARQGDIFGEYDGYVPEAGPELDPFSPDARPLSASRLERLGNCPLDFFFEDVLGIAPPEEHGLDPGVWLDALERGSLLHDVFHAFMEQVVGEGRLPGVERDGGLIREILHQRVAEKRLELPPPSQEVLDREVEAMEKIVHIFLDGQNELLAGKTPAHFEVAIGMPPVGRGTSLDSRREVEIGLPGGRSIRARGQVDRIDEGEGTLALWDYKTGSSWGYDLADPHRGGRRVQNTLYTEMIRARLKELGSGSTIESFGYFFPSLKSYGERISWPARRLEEGPAMLARLCQLLASGCFPETNAPGDLRFSDYTSIRDGVKASCDRILEKAANPSNEMLRPFVELRGLVVEDDDG